MIPLVHSTMVDDIIFNVQQIKDFDGYDPDTGEIIRLIKLDPKYGQGTEKEQRIGLGKAIQSMKIPDDKKKKFLNWFAKYKHMLEGANFLKNMEDYEDQSDSDGESTDYVIVLSRSPIDVVRMSDHRRISSCHSRGNSHFYCAVQEALTGGAIAYLVNFNDLRNYLDSEDFQEDDMFDDRDRRVGGMTAPVARLRIRRIQNTNTEKELALPETRIYGDDSIPDFYTSVRDYIQNHQNLTADTVKQMLGTETHKIRGGSYEDNDTQDLFNSYFDLDNRKDGSFEYNHKLNVSYDDVETEDKHLRVIDDFLEDELKEIHGRYENRFTDVTSWYHVDGDGDEGYFMMNGQIDLDISHLTVDDLFNRDDINDEYEFRRSKKEDDGWGIFADGLDSAITDRSNVTIEGYEVTPEYIRVRVTYRDGGSSSVSDDYDTFCDALLDIDKDTDAIIVELEETLIEAGFVTVPDNMSRITQYKEDDKLPWKYFGITGDHPRNYSLMFIDSYGKIALLGDLKIPLLFTKQDCPNPGFDASFRQGVSDIFRGPAVFKNPLQKFLKDTFEPSTPVDDSRQGVFNALVESYGENSSPLFEFELDAWAGLPYGGGNVLSLDSFKFTPSSWDDEHFELMDYMDQNYNMIIQLFRYAVYNKIASLIPQITSWTEFKPWIETFKPNNYARLHQLFSKYVS